MIYYREWRFLLVPHLLGEPLEVAGVVVGVADVLGDPPQVPEQACALRTTTDPVMRRGIGELAWFRFCFRARTSVIMNTE